MTSTTKRDVFPIGTAYNYKVREYIEDGSTTVGHS